MDWENLTRLRPRDEVKFVISHRADYEYAREAISRYGITERAAAIHMSPVHGVLDPKTLSEWVLADRLPVRVQLQIHKYIWPADTRGVRAAAGAAGSGAAAQRRSRLLHGRGDCARGRLPPHALTIRYGQRHARELESARAVAAALGVVRHIELDVDLSAFGGSSLTTDAPVPKDRRIDAADIPSTYVPARNTVFLALALGWAECLAPMTWSSASTRSITRDIRTAGPSMSRRSNSWLPGHCPRRERRTFRIHAPLQHLTKAAIIRRGIALGLDYV